MYVCLRKENYFFEAKMDIYVFYKKMTFCENGYIRLSQKIQNMDKKASANISPLPI